MKSCAHYPSCFSLNRAPVRLKEFCSSRFKHEHIVNHRQNIHIIRSPEVPGQQISFDSLLPDIAGCIEIETALHTSSETQIP